MDQDLPVDLARLNGIAKHEDDVKAAQALLVELQTSPMTHALRARSGDEGHAIDTAQRLIAEIRRQMKSHPHGKRFALIGRAIIDCLLRELIL